MYPQVRIALITSHMSAPRFVIPSPNQTTAAVQSGLYPPYKLTLVPTVSAHTPISNNGSSSDPGAATSPSPATLTHLSKLLALHIINKTDSADLVRFFWASGYSKHDIVPLVRGALELLGMHKKSGAQQQVEAKTNGAGATTTLFGPSVVELWLSPLLGFLLGLYR